MHYKHPLYDALDKARMLEKKAKNFGRDAVAVGHLTRRGSYSEAVFNWDIVPELDYLVWLIRNSKENEKPNVSRRIIYHVVEEINKVPNDEGAITSFLKYGLLRHYDGDSKEEIVGNLLERIMNIARKLRVEVRLVGVDTREYGLCDEDKKVLEEKLNASIQKLVKNCELSLGKLYDVARIDGVEAPHEKLLMMFFTLAGEHMAPCIVDSSPSTPSQLGRGDVRWMFVGHLSAYSRFSWRECPRDMWFLVICGVYMLI